MNPYTINFPPKKQPEDLKTPDKQALFDEISWSETDVLQSYFPFANNPDSNVRNKGLKIYDLMQKDDQVKISLSMRISARLSSQWEIKAGQEGNAESERMAEFMRFVIGRMSGTFENDLEQIMSAIAYGFSITEKVFDYIESGPQAFKGMIGLRALKTREPFNYDFKTDPHGNLLGLVYTGLTGAGFQSDSVLSGPKDLFGRMIGGQAQAGLNADGTFERPFPKEKFVVYSYNQAFGNWYGRSDLAPAFKWWIMKKHGSKFWAIWLERYASPFIWAQYKREAGLNKTALDRIDDFIRNLSARQGVRVSDAVELKSVEFNAAGGKTYEESIEAYNRFIARSIMIPNLLGFTQQAQVGSYSLGQKHFDAFMWVLNKMARDISETIVGEQIIKPIMRINFKADDETIYPKFQFLSIDDESIDVRAGVIQKLIFAGAVDPSEEWVRDFLTLPKREAVTKSPQAGKEEEADDDEMDPGDGPMKKKEEPPMRMDPEKGMKPPSEPDEKEEKKNASTIENKVAGFAKREANYFERKMDPDSFRKEIDRLDAVVMEELSRAIIEVRDDVIDQLKRKKIIESGDAAEVSRIAVNIRPFKQSIEMWMVKINLDSRLRAFEEIGKAGLEIEVSRKFKAFAAEEKPFEPWTPLPPQDAIDFFRRKVTARIIDANGKKKVVDLTTGMDLSYIRQKAFAVSGIVQADILNDVKQVVLNGLKRGDVAGAMKDIKSLFDDYVQQGIEIDEELLAPSRRRTLVRTNTAEAINEGRAAMMVNPEVGDFVQFFMYTAIMDDRTTDYCRCMDQKVFRIEDLGVIKPPAHFNCRSFTVPVTQFEIEDRAKAGRGVEISEPCPDRMEGFEIKQQPMDIMPVVVVEEPKAVKKSDPADALRDLLEQYVVRCPYKTCRSNDIKYSKTIFSVGEFACDACGLPFRVSKAGDIYLFDPGIDKWERVTEGLQPNYFKSEFPSKEVK